MSDESAISMAESLVAGSEENYDVTCDPCLSDGQQSQATCYCVDCNQNICTSCIKVHKKIPALKDHVIREKTTLSDSQKAIATSSRTLKETDPLVECCQRHPDELIKFYCNTHSKLVCSVCVPLEHRECKDIDYIRDISAGTVDSGELRDLQFDLQTFVAKLTSVKSRAGWIKQVLNDSFMKVVSDIGDLKKEIVERVNRLEKELLDKASRIKADEETKVDGAISTLKSSITESEEIIKNLEKKTMASQINNLFVSMKKSQERLRELIVETNKLNEEMTNDHLSFRPNDNLVTLSGFTSLGTVSLDRASADVNAKYGHDINVKTENDSKNCTISGITAVADGRLALADFDNLSVKLVDVNQCKVTAQIKLDFYPIDLTTLPCDKIAVILKQQRYIQVLSVSTPLSLDYTIAVQGLYRGILHVQGKLFLAGKHPIYAVHVYDTTGTLLQQIKTDFAGNNLFKGPFRMSVTPDHGTLYVTDDEEDTVVSLTLDGRLISKYIDDRLKLPLGVAVDGCGRVLACSAMDHSVNQLSEDGRLLKRLLMKEDGLIGPYAIACANNCLYVSSAGSNPAERNNIKVYSMKS